ncbi:endo-1,4-beta-xylanase, partial [bacterium]|nr:endo-1,4-beta-xylanase [bacterium]
KIKTKLAVSEAAEFNFLYKNEVKHPTNSNQIEWFLDSTSKFYLGDLSRAEKMISGHSYFTTWPVEKMLDTRQKLALKMKAVNPEYQLWQSEYCILGKNDDIKGGNKRDLGMSTALFVARVMHYDLTVANASSWQWWTALSQCNYKDGLIYLDMGNDGIASQDHIDNDSLKYNGNFHDSKLMWAVGNYSRFIRPGYSRVEVNINDHLTELQRAKDIMVSGYVSPAKDQLIMVAVNYSEEDKCLDLSSMNGNNRIIHTYTTSDNCNLKHQSVLCKKARIKARSVVTLLLEL